MNRLIILMMVLLLVTPMGLTMLGTRYLENDYVVIGEAEATEPVTTRGDCYEDTDFQNGTHTFTTGIPCFVNAGTEQNPDYQPFITYEGHSFSDDEYRIGNNLVGYSVWKNNGSVTFYNSDNFTDIKVRYESWKVYYYDDSEDVWTDTEIDDDSGPTTLTAPTVSKQRELFCE